MNAITEVPAATTALVPTDMDQAIRLAKAMSTAKMLPKHLWDDVGTCLMIVEQAMRWNMSPFAVAQCTSSIGGKLMYEGKLLAAAAESVGAIEGHFDYDFAGEGDDRQVTISARRRGDVNPRQMTIRLRDVRTTNEHWKKQPDQMLVYSGARNWTRRFTPSVLLGSYAPEEFNRDGKPVVDDFAGPTLEASPERQAINDAVPLTPKQQRMRGVDATGKPWRSAEGEDADRAEAAERERAAAAATPRPERKIDPTEYDTAEPTDADKWWFNLETKLATAQSQAEVMKIGELKSVKTARASTVPGVQERIMELLANAYARFPTDSKTWTADLSDEALGEVEIAGMEKLASG